jgi:hypothetical protein
MLHALSLKWELQLLRRNMTAVGFFQIVPGG